VRNPGVNILDRDHVDIDTLLREEALSWATKSGP
jgi:hypothetical protein